MKTGELSISVSVNLEDAVFEMYDIVQEVDSMVELVPAWSKFEAEAIKNRITGMMVKWLDSYAE